MSGDLGRDPAQGGAARGPAGGFVGVAPVLEVGVSGWLTDGATAESASAPHALCWIERARYLKFPVTTCTPGVGAQLAMKFGAALLVICQVPLP
ncbi:hypothetical protein GCM10011374_37640 [Kocuria dechangensis]|uniref:Uncharacterized protein n=1 Tax=Kocuria dechangensis TaxID=1176249 RepID=A0A917H737_9MICC|nr:hypothetical protein GCM10011374_37640 [Kocuria dechangensis]